MSCGCSNTTPTVTTTNCGSCGYNCSNCTCPTNPIIEPAVVCADPEPCSELFPLECVIYTGEDIKCLGTANELYPNVLHYVVLKNSTTIGRNFVSILNNINTQLCYLFSKDYISQLLTNIQNDETLSALFCELVSACNCECTLTCPVVTSVNYNLNTLPTRDTVTGTITPSGGGSTISFTGAISGTTLTISSLPVSPGVIAIGQKISGPGVSANTFITAGSASTWTVSVSQTVSSVSMTASWIKYITSLYAFNQIDGNFYYVAENAPTISATFSIEVPSPYDNANDVPWLVSVQANDEIAEMLGNPSCTKGTYEPSDSTPVTIDSCGFGQTVPVTVLECPDICIPNFNLNLTGSFLGFSFTHTAQDPNTYPVDSYTIHWYKQTYFSTDPLLNEYEMQDIGDQDNVAVTSVPQTISITTTIPIGSAPSNNWLILVTPVFENTNCNTGFEVREPIYEVPNKYTGQDFLEQTCNWSIYNHKQRV